MNVFVKMRHRVGQYIAVADSRRLATPQAASYSGVPARFTRNMSLDGKDSHRQSHSLLPGP